MRSISKRYGYYKKYYRRYYKRYYEKSGGSYEGAHLASAKKQK